MNKNCYRIIFSHARNVFIAVAETVKSQTKHTGHSRAIKSKSQIAEGLSPVSYKKINPLYFLGISLLGASFYILPLSSMADSQISVDKTAPHAQQPTILNTANGVIQVNIQTPSAGGVSRNTYSQFDVGQEGVVLNNARLNSQTQLGGWVQGNPWLAKGEAKIILNEVNSTNPSQLKGYIEVAGNRAQVIVANPAGLVCDGCGVINADRFTLTTGQPVVNKGNLEAFRVREGQITIAGKGLNGSLTPYTDIYAHALTVNAGLYANDLNVALGHNDITLKDQSQPEIQQADKNSIQNNDKPVFALDIGQLGSMYAGKIFLVGTEQGLGVRNAGSLNSATGQLSLTANGDLINSGNIIANNEQVQIKAQALDNQGNISSTHAKVQLDTAHLKNSGIISTADELSINNQGQLSNSGTLNAGRLAIDSQNLQNSGSIEQTGLQSLALQAGVLSNQSGRVGLAKPAGSTGETPGSAGNPPGSGGSITPVIPVNSAQDGGKVEVAPNNSHEPKAYETGYIHVNGQLNNDQGALAASGGIDLDSQDGLDNHGGQLRLGTITVQGKEFNNIEGQLTVKNAQINTQQFNNQSGVLNAEHSLSIDTQNLNNNKGKIEATDQLALNVHHELNNREGQLASDQQLTVKTGQLMNQSGLLYSEQKGIQLSADQAINNRAGIIQAKTTLDVKSDHLDNTSGQIRAENITQQHDQVVNQQGLITASRQLQSKGTQFDNNAGQIHAEQIDLQQETFNNQTGQVYANKTLNITGQNLTNNGLIAAGQQLDITTQHLIQQSQATLAAGLDQAGHLGTSGDLTITANQAQLQGHTLAAGSLLVDASQNIMADQGKIYAKNIQFTAQQGHISTQNAHLDAQEQLKLSSHDVIDNQKGQLSAAQLQLEAQVFNNSQGNIQHTGTGILDLNFAQQLNNQSGVIQSNAGQLNIATAVLNNQAGQLVHAGQQQLTIHAGQIEGRQGQILSNGTLKVDAGQINLDQGTTAAEQIDIQAEALSQQQGQLLQRGKVNPLTLAIKKEFNNQQGIVQSQAGVSLSSDSLNNQGGQVAAAQNLQLNLAGQLDNSQSGKIYADHASVKAGSINNSAQGQINAQHNLSLTSQQHINNQSGTMAAHDTMLLHSQGLDNHGGQIGSDQGSLTIDAGAGVLVNQQGVLQAKDNVKLTAGQINNQSGLINTQQSLAIDSIEAVNNRSGQMIASQDIQLQSQGLNNNQGQLGTLQGSISLNTGSGTINNADGSILSARDLALYSQQLDNQSGVILAQQQSTLDIKKIDNQKGQLSSGKAIQITGKQFNNREGIVQTKSDLTLNLDGLLDNSQSGQLVSGGNTQIKTNSLNNSSQGQINAQKALTVEVSQAVDNQSGLMLANHDITVTSEGLDNSKGQIGSVAGQLHLDSRSGGISNQLGRLQAGSTLSIIANSLNNDAGIITALGSGQISSQTDLSNRAGQIASNGALEVSSLNLDNQAGHIQSGDHSSLTLNAQGGLRSTAGTIHSGSDLTIQTGRLDNDQQGQISAQRNLEIMATGQLNNQTGQIIADQRVQLASQGLNNDQGKIGSLASGLTIDAGNETLSNQSGLLQAKTDVNAQAAAIANTVGQISAQAKINLHSLRDINNQQGQIVGDQEVHISAQGLNSNNGLISSAHGNVVLDAGTGELSNQAGTVSSGQALQLSANRIDNRNAGQLHGQTTVNVKTASDINNQGGVIAANQQVKLDSQGLNNDQGHIGSIQADLNIEAGQKALSNIKGVLQGGQNLHVQATGIDNTDGTMVTVHGLTLDSREQGFNNTGGTLNAGQADISSGQLINNKGLIQAKNGISINTHQQDLINSNSGVHSGIVTEGSIQLQNLAALDNQHGYLASGQQLDIQANQLLNQHGTLLASDQLNITGTGVNQLLDNQSGQLLSMGNMTLAIDRLNNQGKLNAADAASRIVAANQLSITTQQLDNQNTLIATAANDPAVQGIDAKDVILSTAILNNQQGAIRSSGNQQLTISQQLNNQRGEISSQQQLGISGEKLLVNNQNGKLLAGTQLNLTAQSLSGDGRVLSLGSAALELQDDYQHGSNAQLQANQDLNLTTQGNLVNQGVINAGNQLNLHAANIINAKDSRIESRTTQLTAQDQLNNKGLINGDDTRIQAQLLNNEGTGRIYGTTLAIAANTLNNRPDSQGTAPVIASRGDLHLGVQSLNNLANTANYDSQAMVFSAGNLYLGGALDANHQATGQAQVINNESATIESLGDMRLAAHEINNINKNFSTHDVEVSRTENLYKFFWGWYSFNAEKIADKNPKEDYSEYFYTKTISQTQVRNSAPAKITAGGNMDLSGAQVLNDKSWIQAGGVLSNEGGTIYTPEVTGTENEKVSGKRFLYEKRSGKDIFDWSDFEYNQPKTINLSVGKTLDKQNLSQNNLETTAVANNQSSDTINDAQVELQHVNDLQAINTATQVNQAQNSQGQDLSAGDTQQVVNQVKVNTELTNQGSQQERSIDVSVGEATAVNTRHAGQAQSNNLNAQGVAPDAVADGNSLEIRSINNNGLKLPNNALYHINATSQADYLVETDPAFANYRNWLSSDYMLNALGLDPALQQKRLGDGFYEQRLVQDQVSQLTGYRFLTGYTTDEAQYKALMNNGLTFAKNYNLRPGIALTAAQIAQLTSDIVWLEEKDVVLPNGTAAKALVPQVYVKARTGDLQGDGSLISAQAIDLKLDGDLINGATIAGREAVRITADNINNLSGRIQGNQVALNAQKDLNNIGGVIEARDSMSLKVGGNLNMISTIRTGEAQIGGFKASNTALDRVAALYVGDSNGLKVNLSQPTLIVDVAGNSTLKAAQIQNANGASIITTQGQVDIGTVNIGKNEQFTMDAKNGYRIEQKQDVGSQLGSIGSLAVNGQNIHVQGSGLDSQKGITQLTAADNITIEEGHQSSEMQSQWYSKSKGLLGSKKQSSALHNQSNEAIASTVEGNKVSLNANNINIRGSNVVSDQLTQIQAKENVSITGAENQYLNQSENVVKKSGLMSSGGIGFSIGEKNESTEQQNTQRHNSGSMVGSLKGNTTIIAGNTYQQTGSTVSSQLGDVNILAQKVNIEAAKEQSTSQYKHEQEQKGLTVALNVPVVSAVQRTLDSVKQVGQSKSDRVNAMAAANAGFDAYKAGQALGTLKNAADSVSGLKQAADVSITATYGEQKNTEQQQTQSTTASQSQVYAGGKTSIVATSAGEQSDINIIGSDVVGLQGTTLTADHDVNIKAAQQTSKEQSSNTSKGWNAGVIAGTQTGLGVTAGANAGKGRSEGVETSYVNSHVGSKDSQTSISSDNATNIIGGQVLGKGVQITANELNVQSLQDSATYTSKQQNMDGQVIIGTNGASVSGSIGKSNINSSYASVNEQSGIFAGDNGYQIKVNNNTDLKGAIITSTQTAEDLRKNSLDTGTLSYSDIQNHSAYDAKGFSVGAGYNQNKGTVLSNPSTIDQHASSTKGVSKSIGFGLDSDNQQSITRSGIMSSTAAQGNIKINNEAAQQQLTGKTAEQIKSDILTSTTTDNAREKSGALVNHFDKDKVQAEINTQVGVTRHFDENRQEAKAQINSLMDKAKQQYENGDISNADYVARQKDLQRLSLILDSVSAGLSAPTTSAARVAAATLSPAASYEIGQYFKGKDAEGSAAHILAHTVLGAAVAAAGGNDALSAGLAAGGAEAAAPVLSHYLYGKDAKNLTADEKSTISAITGLVASGVGASTGDIGSTVQSGQAAQNAVEENYQTRQTLAIINKKLQACTPSDRTCITKAVLDLRAADKTLDDALNLCAQTGNSACVEAHLKNILSSDSSAEMKEMALQLQRLKIATEVSGALNETNNLGAGTARQIEFLRYAQRQCQGITYGACGSQYNKLQLSAAQKVLIPAKSAVKDYIVGEKPRTGASYYIAGVGYVAAELLLPESGTDLALTAVGAGAVKGASLASREAKAAEAVRQKQVVENNFNAENVGYGNAAIRDFQPGKTHRAENINAGQVTDRDGLVRVDERSVSKTPKTLNDQQVYGERYPTGYPAWKPGTTVTDRVVTQPEKMRMVIDQEQYINMQEAIEKGQNPAQKLGGWATKEPVNSIADMRNKLAVTEEFKPNLVEGKRNKFYVVEFEVQPGVGIREGKAGSMYDYKTGKVLPGNAQQMNFVDKSPYTNPELFKINSTREIK